MLTAARGVSLGLGRINLSDLHTLPKERADLGKLRRIAKPVQKSKIIVKKHIDSKTLWAACRAVVFGTVVIIVGMLMTVVGYFDVDLSEERKYNKETGKTETIVDMTKRYQLKSLQYIGPILMGIGSFILIIACVITLESRDKHAQIIHEESNEFRKMKNLLAEGQEQCSVPAESAVEVASEEGRGSKQRFSQETNENTNETTNVSDQKASSASCLPQLLQKSDTGYYDDVKELQHVDQESGEESAKLQRHEKTNNDETQSAFRQSIVAEVHVAPRAVASGSSNVLRSPPVIGRAREQLLLQDSCEPRRPQAKYRGSRRERPSSLHETCMGQGSGSESAVRAVVKLARPRPLSDGGGRAPIAQLDLDLPSPGSSPLPLLRGEPLTAASPVTPHSVVAMR